MKTIELTRDEGHRAMLEVNSGIYRIREELFRVLRNEDADNQACAVLARSLDAVVNIWVQLDENAPRLCLNRLEENIFLAVLNREIGHIQEKFDNQSTGRSDLTLQAWQHSLDTFKEIVHRLERADSPLATHIEKVKTVYRIGWCEQNEQSILQAENGGVWICLHQDTRDEELESMHKFLKEQNK